MDIQAVTRIDILIRLGEEEAQELLADPHPFQSALRQTLAGVQAEKKNGGGTAITRRAAAQLPQPASTLTTGKSVCPKCHLVKDNRGYAAHVRACPGAVSKE